MKKNRCDEMTYRQNLALEYSSIYLQLLVIIVMLFYFLRFNMNIKAFPVKLRLILAKLDPFLSHTENQV